MFRGRVSLEFGVPPALPVVPVTGWLCDVLGAGAVPTFAGVGCECGPELLLVVPGVLPASNISVVVCPGPVI